MDYMEDVEEGRWLFGTGQLWVMVVAGTGMRGEAKMKPVKCWRLRNRQTSGLGMSSTWNKSEGKKEWKEDCTRSKWKTGGIQNFNINIYYWSNMPASTVGTLHTFTLSSAHNNPAKSMLSFLEKRSQHSHVLCMMPKLPHTGYEKRGPWNLGLSSYSYDGGKWEWRQ